MKTLLVAAGLAVGASNAWAADTFLTTWTGQVGTAGNEGSFKYATKKVNIAAGETYVYTLTNYNGGDENSPWLNWVVEGNLGSKYFDCEARGYQWQSGEGPVPSYTQVIGTSDVENWMTKYNGATVTITISRNAAGTQYTVTHTSNVKGTTEGNTDKYYGGTWTVAVNAEDNWDIYITEESSHFDVTKVSYTDASSNTFSTAIESLPYTRTWTSGQKSFPFNAGEAVTGTNITAWSKNSNSAATAYAYFDSDPSTNGNQAYSLSENETVTLSFTAYEGWLGTANTATVKLLNSGGVSLAEYVYNVNSTNITDVKFNGTTATGFTTFSGISKYNATKDANGFSGNGKPYLTNTNYNPTVTFTVSDNGYVTFTFVSEKAGTQSFNATLPTSGGSAVKMDLASICVIDNISNSDRALGINNLSITSAIAAKYTVTFTYEDTDGNSLSALKANSTTQAVAGTSIESLISAAMQSSFYNGDASIRYDYSTFAADGNATTVPASDITVKLKFAPKAKFTRSVQAVEKDNTSNVLKADLASGYAYAGDNLKLHWSKYIYANSKWNQTTTLTGTYTTSGTSDIEFSSSDINYFFEFEDLAKSGSFAATQDGDDLSNNNSARFAKNSRAWTSAIAAGTYTLNIYCYGTNAKSPTMPMYYCDTDGSNLVYIGEATAATASSWELKEKTGIVIPEGKALCLYNTDGSNNSNYLVDYFTLKRTGDFTVPVSISTAGWATLYSQYALDFSTLSSDFTAYTATLDEDKGIVTLTEVSDVPANTGVVLKATSALAQTENYSIPMATSSSTPQGSLTGNASESTAYNAFDGYDLYMLALNASDEAQFTKVSTGSIAVGKAFLKVSKAGGARTFNVVFADEANGISGIEAEKAGDGQAYNLAGQRVAKTQKGLYIVNGKKVIIK